MLRNSGFCKTASVDILERVLYFTIAATSVQHLTDDLWLIDKDKRYISVSECIVILNLVSADILKEITLVVLNVAIVF